MLSPVPLPVTAVSDALHDLPVSWAIAGGWAIDLALGRVTRTHGDVDIAVFRADQAALRTALPAWTFDVVISGVRVPWPAGVWLELPIHEVYGWQAPGTAALEFLLNERDGTDWVYRRDPAVRRPLSQALHPGPGGVWVLAPEIVLLYKSKAPRAADEQDFGVARELLDAEARAWLHAALVRREPRHPWAVALAAEA